jgi:DNA-binding NtrC family response regulator
MMYRILVLSSDSVYRRAVGLSLRQLNEDILFADSIEQALRLTEQTSPTLLVTDCSISRLGDGFQFAVAMHERDPRLQCVVTGDTDLADYLRVAQGMNWLQIFRRPFSMVGFLTGIIRALEQPAIAEPTSDDDSQAKLNVVAFPKRQLAEHSSVIRPAEAN